MINTVRAFSLVMLPLLWAPEAAFPASYASRDGAAEARADLARTGVFWLYSHAHNGRVPQQISPGLKNCDERNATSEAFEGRSSSPFLSLPEADWGEGMPITGAWADRAGVAIRFARSYNLEMYRLKGDEIRQACPRVELDLATD